MPRSLHTVLGDGFRVFFLAAVLSGIAAMGYWMLWLGVHAAGGMVTATPFAAPPHHWHAHEMIWGYGAAVLGGFFLTAVPSWTGEAPARRRFLLGAAGLWLAGRAAVWGSAGLDPWAVAAVDLAFLPVLGLRLVAMLMRRPKPQNLMVLGLLGLFWAGNIAVHLDWTGLAPGLAGQGLRAGLLTLAAMIAIIGGRITPAFTGNAMRAAGAAPLPRSRRALDAGAIAAAIALPVLVLAGAGVAAESVAAGLAGLLLAARLAGWRGWWTRRDPLLWMMHVAYALLAAGLLALALAGAGVGSAVGALHLVGIGAVGGMTLAVMTRASLGHTGRALVAPAPAVAGFVALVIAAGLREAASAGGLGLYYPATLGAGALWICGFAALLAALWTPLTEPRADRPAAG